MVEGCSCKRGEGGPPWLERCAAGLPPAASWASNHRSNPSFKRARHDGLRLPRPAAQVQCGAS